MLNWLKSWFEPDPEFDTDLLHERLDLAGELGVIQADYIAKYAAFLNASPWGILVTNTNYKILFMNKTLERVSGWDLEEVRGKHMQVLIPENVRDVHEAHELEFQQNPRTRHGDFPFEPQLLTKNGDLVEVEISLGYEHIDGTLCYFASIRPRETLPVKEC